MSDETPKETQKSQTEGKEPPKIRKQGPTPQSIPGQQINARGKNADFAQSDIPQQAKMVIRNMATTIKALRKENAELKAKIAEARKNP